MSALVPVQLCVIGTVLSVSEPSLHAIQCPLLLFLTDERSTYPSD